MSVRTKLLAGLAATAALWAGSVPAVSHGMAAVGDEVKVSFKTVDGGTVNVEQLHGKLVVLDY